MKKKNPKLHLHRETLRLLDPAALSDEELLQVAGGNASRGGSCPETCLPC